MLTAIIVMVFVASFLLIFTIAYVVALRRDPVRTRLEQLAGSAGVAADGGYDFRKSLLGKGVDLLAANVQDVNDTRAWLARAGYFQPSAVYNFYLTTLMLVLIGLFAAIHTGMQIHLATPKIAMLALGAGALGGLLPRMFVARRISKRREAIRQAVPNMLDLLVVCVEAGLSFTAGIQKLSEEMRIGCLPLAQELKIVTQEILIGKSKSDVFRSLANRTEVEELRALAVTLIQADRLGTSIGTSLRVLADSMRFKRRQRAEEAANKVSVKLVFPLVLLIFPELLIVLVGPAMISIFRTLQDVAK
ncbi:MAG: type II secretion system F family protein [Candidatus Zixiibacteriota bacterium]